MPIVCAECGHSTDEVRYRRPSDRPRAVRLLKVALYLAAFFAVTSTWSLLQTLLPLTQMAGVVRLAVEQGAAVQSPEMRDFIRVASNLIVVAFVTAVVVFLTLVVRYLRVLVRLFRKANPTILNRIRRLAWLQLWAQLGSAALVLAVFQGLETQSVAPSLGPGIIMGPIILYLARRDDVRHYFSHFRVVEAPKLVARSAGATRAVSARGAQESCP